MSKIGKLYDQRQPYHVGRKKDGELWSKNKNVIIAHVDPPKLHFSPDFISARRGCWPLKFLYALEIDQGMLAHPRGPLRWALPRISSFTCFCAGMSRIFAWIFTRATLC